MTDTDTYIRVTGRYAMLAQGLIDVADLDDDELSQGRLKDKNGNFSGRPPKMIPMELVQAMRREWLSRAEAKLRNVLYDSLDGYAELARDKTIDPSVRIRAMDRIVERTMGKVPDKVQISAEDPIEALFRKVLEGDDALVPYEPSAEERALI
jgi:hypothetical protein